MANNVLGLLKTMKYSAPVVDTGVKRKAEQEEARPLGLLGCSKVREASGWCHLACLLIQLKSHQQPKLA